MPVASLWFSGLGDSLKRGWSFKCQVVSPYRVSTLYRELSFMNGVNGERFISGHLVGGKAGGCFQRWVSL